MINLKEAGRYSKYLTEALTGLTQMPNLIKGNLVKQTEDHFKSRALKDESDVLDKEVVVKVFSDATAEEVKTLIMDVIEEKVRLANAIAAFKASNNVELNGRTYSLDAAIEYAKTVRMVTERFFTTMENFEDDVYETKAYDKTFNAEGNQTTYEYPLVRKSKVMFDKDVFRTQNKVYNRLANGLSMEIENLSSLKAIDFTMKYDYLGKLEDLIETVRG